jgi:hypothetical protein
MTGHKERLDACGSWTKNEKEAIYSGVDTVRIVFLLGESYGLS